MLAYVGFLLYFCALKLKDEIDSMDLQKLPMGEQDFETLRRENRLYIDKTELIYQMVQDGTYYFLSRPRRFGKSLLLSTLVGWSY